MDSTEIEFKFKISKEELENYLIKILEYIKWSDKKTGLACPVKINPCFSIYSDTYYRAAIYGSEHDIASKFNFFRKRVDKSNNVKFNPELFESDRIDFRRTFINTVEDFLNCGQDSILVHDMLYSNCGNSHNTETKTYFSIKKKNIVDGIESNYENEAEANENVIAVINDLLEYTMTKKYFHKEKRKAIIIDNNNSIRPEYDGCRIEIVSVVGNEEEQIEEYYLECEWTLDRMINKKELSEEDAMDILKQFVIKELGSIPDEFDSRNWKQILKDRIFKDRKKGETNG